MNISDLANIQSIAAELSLSEKAISSAKVILTGFVVVFAMLFLLIVIIKIYSTIVSKAQGAGDKTRKKEKVSGQPIKPPTAEQPTAAKIFAPASDDEIPGEVIAVIAAAVDSVYGSSGKARIKSIKKSGGRSAWANAGVIENTRSF